MGTVLSSVPWMMSVGTLNAAMSGRKSVVANDLAQPSVAFRPACIETFRAHCSRSSLTACESTPMPKKSLKKLPKNLARSSVMPFVMASKTDGAVPSGLSAVFSMKGTTDDTSADLATPLPACRDTQRATSPPPIENPTSVASCAPVCSITAARSSASVSQS